MSTSSAAGLLRRAAPGAALHTGADASAWRVAGRSPDAVVVPGSVDELAAVLELASREGWAVLPSGAGSWLDAGDPLPDDDRPRVVVTTGRLREVVEYEPANLTATVEGGVGFRALQGLCRKRGQWIPVDPPGDARGTVGATLATGSDGPLRLYHGALANHVLGITLVTGDGRVLELGGRVVKNVAGFDLVRLAVGCWGTLGVVAGATLRLSPFPADDRTLLFGAGDAAGAVERGRSVATGRREPVALEVLSPGFAASLPGSPGGWTVAVRIQGTTDAVEALADEISEGVGETPTSVLETDGSGALWEAIASPEEEGAWSLRARVLPARTDRALEIVEGLEGGDASAGFPGDSAIAAGPGTGIVRVTFRPGEPSGIGAAEWTEGWAARLERLRSLFEEEGGSLTILRAPTAVLRRVGAWGDPGPAGRLSRELRERFDPAGVLNPGRLGL